MCKSLPVHHPAAGLDGRTHTKHPHTGVPTSVQAAAGCVALDAITRRDLQVWLEEVWQADRRSVLLVTHDVDEAILLSDRVVVLSDRPAHVVADIAVGLPRPRSAALVADAAFGEVRAEVLARLQQGHRSAR